MSSVFVMNLCDKINKNFLLDPKVGESFVKGRRDDWQHEIYQGQAKSNTKFCYGDRFIPKRFKRENIDCNRKYVGKNKETDILKTDLKVTTGYWRQNSFVTAMNNTFHIRKSRLLQFSNLQSPLFEYTGRSSIDNDWPCMPRSKPMAFPSATHEMPELCMSFDYNLIDWSINDQIAVSFGKDVIIWRNADETTMVFSVKQPSSLKYSPNGRFLAIGCIDHQYPVLELWKLQKPNEYLVADGKYFQKSVESICCIEWTPDSEEIVCGTGCGLIVVLRVSTMSTIYKIRRHYCKISCIRFSPNGRYLATGDIEGQVYIFNSNQYKTLLRLGAKAGGISFDWHPWSGVELAISELSPTSIYIIHVQRREIVAFYQRNDEKIYINSINFSKITGELLVNILRVDSERGANFEILVLSSLNRVVDILGDQERGSVFMMWSPDGTRVATCGFDESFSIWNFYPNSKVDANTKKRLRKEHNSCIELFRPLK